MSGVLKCILVPCSLFLVPCSLFVLSFFRRKPEANKEQRTGNKEQGEGTPSILFFVLLVFLVSSWPSSNENPGNTVFPGRACICL